MERKEIMSLLVRRGITVTSIARKMGISQPAVSATISGRENNKRIQKAVARAIKMKVEEVFTK